MLVLSGPTGCGKSTQLPHMILQHMIERGDGGLCNIVCTQPRRISATSVAARVAVEMGETVGQTVGYQIRLEKRASSKTRVLFCTVGILLRTLLSSELDGVSHVIVDEVHERDSLSDFLLIILRDLLKKRPTLKLVHPADICVYIYVHT